MNKQQKFDNVKYLIENLQLLEELEKLGTGGRVLRYGPINTFFLMLSRGLHGNVNKHVIDFLEKIDKVIINFESSGYRIRINKTDLGEVYNRSRTYPRENYKTASKEEKEDIFNNEKFWYTNEGFFKSVIKNINVFMREILNTSVDYMYDNDISNLQNIASLNSFINIKTNDNKIKEVQSLINEYSDFIVDMPNRFFAGLISKKNQYMSSSVVNEALDYLSKELVTHISTKYSINPNTSHTVFNR